MIIIDIDAHQEPAHDWLDDEPALRERLRGKLFPESDPRTVVEAVTKEQMIEQAAAGLCETVQKGLPPDKRVPLLEIASDHYKRAHEGEMDTPVGAFEYEGADNSNRSIRQSAFVGWTTRGLPSRPLSMSKASISPIKLKTPSSAWTRSNTSIRTCQTISSALRTGSTSSRRSDTRTSIGA